MAPALGVHANPCKGLIAPGETLAPSVRGGHSEKRLRVRVSGRHLDPNSRDLTVQGEREVGALGKAFVLTLPHLSPSRFFFGSLTSCRRHTPLPLSHTRRAHTRPPSLSASCPIYLGARIWNPRGRSLPQTQDSRTGLPGCVSPKSASILGGREQREGERGRDHPSHAHTR